MISDSSRFWSAFTKLGHRAGAISVAVSAARRVGCSASAFDHGDDVERAEEDQAASVVVVRERAKGFGAQRHLRMELERSVERRRRSLNGDQ